MRAVVTGAAGFIGSHLVDRLRLDGWDVVLVDDLSAGRADRIPSGCQFHQEDVGTWATTNTEPFDVIFHLAARLGPAEVVADPLACLREHYDHAMAMCELACLTEAVLVMASSSEVYGFNTHVPLREDDPLLIGPSHLPRCGYGVSKLAVEHIGLAYHRQHGVRVVLPRLFNIAGARQRPSFVLPIFARQALSGRPITVHGDGAQTRVFTHVDDCVAALLRLARNGIGQGIGHVVNVGAPGPGMPIAQAAMDIRAYCQATYGTAQVPIQHRPYAETGDGAWERFRVREPDTTKLTRLTGLPLRSRWGDIVRDVCDDQARQLGLATGEAA